MADVKKLAEELVNLTVKEVNELATILKEEYGIEPAAAAVAEACFCQRRKFTQPDRPVIS
jgi:large subunit ribosomal protein L7/L12